MIFLFVESILFISPFFCYSYRDDRDRHRQDDKSRPREKERREREYESEREKDRDRHERYERRSLERKKGRKSLSPYSQKSRGEPKDLSPERSTKKKEKEHEEKVEEKKKEKKIKEKKKKKDSDEKEKKKKKKKDKKSSQKETPKDDTIKMEDTLLVEDKTTNDTSSSPLNKLDTMKTCNEEDNIENRIECIASEVPIVPIKEEFEDKSLAMNPEPPEFNELSPGSGRLDRAEFGTNPPNPNFKPIPELKSDIKPIDSLYGGLDDTEINTVITEKYSLLSEHSQTETKEVTTMLSTEKSPKKDEFLAPIPELSKWERDDTIEKPDDNNTSESPTEKIQREDEPKSMKMVTSEVLKRAENAIFQKAINAIRPIEIKKISESRKILYQNPEPKVLETVEPTANREPRKSVNVTINVGRNERNVEITEPVKKAKLDRTKFKPVPETAYSPTRLSAKERLGEKIEEGKERKISPIKGFLERRDMKNENQSRSRSPRREKRISPPLLERRVEPSSLGLATSGERKVYLDERKRDNKDRGDRSKERSDFRGDRHGGDLRSERESRIDCRTDFRSNRNDVKGERVEKDRDKERDRERRGRTPLPSCAFKRTDMTKISLLKSKDDDEERRRDKKSREEKKRKKEHRSRSKSKEHKKRKEKKHKKDKDKNQEKKQKHKEGATSKDGKSDGNETKINYENIEPPLAESLKKQRKNPRLVSDRKRSILDEASFEPDYSASDSESDGEDGKGLQPAKKLKLDETELDKEVEMKSLKKRSKSSTSEDTSSSSDTTSSDSDSSDESHKKKKKKHKKHKKKKSAKKDSSSDSDTYSDSSDSSSDEEKHKKKSKKSKSKSKQSKKKKKSKHK